MFKDVSNISLNDISVMFVSSFDSIPSISDSSKSAYKKESYERQKEQNKIYFIFILKAGKITARRMAKVDVIFYRIYAKSPWFIPTVKAILIRYLPCSVFLRNTNNPSVIITHALERKYKSKVIEYSKFIYFKVGTISIRFQAVIISASCVSSR